MRSCCYPSVWPKAAAKFNEGVLELTLPKRAASPNKRLTVE